MVGPYCARFGAAGWVLRRVCADVLGYDKSLFDEDEGGVVEVRVARD
jgi:hypothetical protein